MSISMSMKSVLLAGVLAAGTAAAVGMNLVAERSDPTLINPVSVTPLEQPTDQNL